MSKVERMPYIVCCGTNGRCVVYGYSETEPEQAQPARLHDARMIVRWTENGLLGVAAEGPRDGSRITSAVATTVTSPVTEWVAVSAEAAERIDAWPAL